MPGSLTISQRNDGMGTMMPARQLLFGLQLDALRMNDVVDRCRGALQSRKRMLIGVVNAAKIVNMQADDMLRDSVLECDVVLADGQSVVWASRLLRRPLPERVAGIDLFSRLLVLANEERCSVYLLGAKPDVLTALCRRIRRDYPHVIIAGSHHGYFGNADQAAIAAQIQNSRADMLFIGMTSPKKEIFLGSYGARLGVPILHGVGGSFDVLAGITRRAPVFWQRAGLEWAYRLLQEPRRLWRRYLKTNSRFIWLTLLESIKPMVALGRPKPDAGDMAGRT